MVTLECLCGFKVWRPWYGWAHNVLKEHMKIEHPPTLVKFTTPVIVRSGESVNITLNLQEPPTIGMIGEEPVIIDVEAEMVD